MHSSLFLYSWLHSWQSQSSQSFKNTIPPKRIRTSRNRQKKTHPTPLVNPLYTCGSESKRYACSLYVCFLPTIVVFWYVELALLERLGCWQESLASWPLLYSISRPSLRRASSFGVACFQVFVTVTFACTELLVSAVVRVELEWSTSAYTSCLLPHWQWILWQRFTVLPFGE